MPSLSAIFVSKSMRQKTVVTNMYKPILTHLIGVKYVAKDFSILLFWHLINCCTIESFLSNVKCLDEVKSMRQSQHWKTIN